MSSGLLNEEGERYLRAKPLGIAAVQHELEHPVLSPADRFVVQCHLDEVDPDAVPEWYILYRRSAAKLTSVDLTQDVVHRSRFAVRDLSFFRLQSY